MVEFKTLSIDEITDYFNGETTGIFYIGGNWCKHCESTIDLFESILDEKGVKEVYTLDPVYKNVFSEDEDFRDCKSLEIKLKYYLIIEKCGFKSDEFVPDTLIPRMHVPFYIGLKNGVCTKFYSIELEKKDNKLVKEGSDLDYTNEYKNNIIELIDSVYKK